MKTTVLLIDTNPAIQAMCALALANLPIELTVSSDPAHARKVIEEECPDIILCSADISHFDILSYIKELKTSGNAATCFFAALISSESSEEIQQSTLIDATLKKPFKSDKLSSLVSDAILKQQEKLNALPHLVLINTGPLVCLGLKSLLATTKARVSVISKDEVIDKPHLPYTACICDSKHMAHFTWYSEDAWGPMIVLQDEAYSGKLPEQTEKLMRPLNLKALSSKLSKWHSLPIALKSPTIKRSKTEQAKLAARLGAELFHKLMISNEIVEGSSENILLLSKRVLEDVLSEEQ